MNRLKLILLFLLLISVSATGQELRFKGMATTWSAFSKSNEWAYQFGGRLIPGFEFNTPLNDKLSIEGRFSANLTGSYTDPSSEENWYGRLKPYRMWTKISGNQFEIRAGLQKINFGSATILRPLMWFDRIDPRDPLQLTDGVYGLLGRYYTINNVNFWAWGLYGNKTKGWETMETMEKNIEFGGRLQFPIPRAEIGLTYHHRKAGQVVFPDFGDPFTASIPENRFAADIKADLGIGLWIENVLMHTNFDAAPSNYESYEFTNMFTAGADYTFGIGNGLNIMLEHLNYSFSSNIFGNDESVNLTAFSANYPFSIFTSINYISYIDWRNKNTYHFVNLGLTFDRFSYYLMGFINPLEFGLFDFETGPTLFVGKGMQIMVVYNF